MLGYLPANCLLKSSLPYSVMAANNTNDKKIEPNELKDGLNVV